MNIDLDEVTYVPPVWLPWLYWTSLLLQYLSTLPHISFSYYFYSHFQFTIWQLW